MVQVQLPPLLPVDAHTQAFGFVDGLGIITADGIMAVFHTDSTESPLDSVGSFAIEIREFQIENESYR
jgi:hypothetical protein